MCAIYLNMHVNIIKLKYCWAYSTHHNTSLIHSFCSHFDRILCPVVKSLAGHYQTCFI